MRVNRPTDEQRAKAQRQPLHIFFEKDDDLFCMAVPLYVVDRLSISIHVKTREINLWCEPALFRRRRRRWSDDVWREGVVPWPSSRSRDNLPSLDRLWNQLRRPFAKEQFLAMKDDLDDRYVAVVIAVVRRRYSIDRGKLVALSDGDQAPFFQTDENGGKLPQINDHRQREGCHII